MLRLSTQISSDIYSRKAPLQKVQDELRALDITVTRPKDGLVFTQTPWNEYEGAVATFEAIARSSFHIIWNDDGRITADMAHQIIFAMAKNKAVVMLKKPNFTADVDSFMRDSIVSRLRLFQIVKLPELEPAEINFILKRLPEVYKYNLSEYETTLVQSRVKAYFRDLHQLAQEQEQQLADEAAQTQQLNVAFA